MHSVLYDIYVLWNIHQSENSYFERIFKYKVSQKTEQNIIHNMRFIICLSQYALKSMPFTVCTSQYALHSMHFTICTSQYAFRTMYFSV